MESHNYLGIYLREDRATVVCLAAQGRGRKLLDCFSVSVQDEQEPTPQMLADRIAEACATRRVRFAEAAVALDCALFMQHAVHSEFSDHKRISATVRFDTEEVLASDVTDVATAYRIVSSDDDGSHLDVYTAQRSVLSDVILSLQHSHIDPVTVDPDVCCLGRYLNMYAGTAEPSENGTLYALLSDSRGYLLGIPKPSEMSAARAFPIASTQDRSQLLVREILVTKALAESVGPVDHLRVLDSENDVTAEQLGDRVVLRAEACSLREMAAMEAKDIADCPNAVDFALAYGAALAFGDKDKSINFRNDHMPFQGKKLRMNRALKFLSISATILLLAVGVFVHTQMLTVNRDRRALRLKFEPDYLAVVLGKESLPAAMKEAVGDLKRALTNIQHEKTGIGAEESISARLTLVLQALNSCAAQTELNIDSITTTEKDILINADIKGRGQTVTAVFDALKNAGFKVEGDRVNSKGDRTVFAVTVEPEKRIGGD